jgi:hypothetical protein
MTGRATSTIFFVWGKDFYCQEAGGQGIILFVVMEIMSTHFSRFSRIGAIACGVLLAGSFQLFAGEIVSTDKSPAYSRNIARFSVGARIDDNLAQVALISDHPTFGYTLPDGNSELVLSLSKIANFDVISFVNQGTAGTVTISTSNSRLAAGSSQWHQIAKQDLTSKVTKINVGPTEAKYIKFSFHVANSGKIAQLAVYSNAKLTIANTALAGGSEGSVDGKDAKDFGGGKEAKEVAEGPPEEGPPPNLPDPPPFVFTPIRLAPLSP